MSLLCSDPLFLLSTFFFFFNDTATTEIYTLSLHDALPICLDVLVEPGTRPLLRDPHRVLDRLHRGRTVTDDRGAVNAEERGAAHLGIVDAPAEALERGHRQFRADPGSGVPHELLLDHRAQHLGEALGDLEGDVAREAVGHDH